MAPVLTMRLIYAYKSRLALENRRCMSFHTSALDLLLHDSNQHEAPTDVLWQSTPTLRRGGEKDVSRELLKYFKKGTTQPISTVHVASSNNLFQISSISNFRVGIIHISQQGVITVRYRCRVGTTGGTNFSHITCHVRNLDTSSRSFILDKSFVRVVGVQAFFKLTCQCHTITPQLT